MTPESLMNQGSQRRPAVCRLEQDSRGTILHASVEAAGLFRTDSDNLRGLRLTDLVVARAHPAMLDAVSEAAQCGEADVQLPLRQGAAMRFGRFRIRRMGDGGFVTKLIGSDREMPEARNDNPADESPNEADRLANVSHEIRTPLNAVIGFADALRQESFGPLGDRRYRDYAQLIQESGQHVLELVNDLLDLSKAEANKVEVERETVDLRTLIERCSATMQLEAERAGLELDTIIAPSVGQGRIDPKILRQVLLNLLSNALKFTERGTVSVIARVLDGRLVVTVSDTGVGMSADDLARIGQRYVQAREAGVRGARGTGLGLALSRALTTAHGGRLDIESQAGSGTTVTLTLPISGSDHLPRYRRAAGPEAGSVLAFPNRPRHAG